MGLVAKMDLKKPMRPTFACSFVGYSSGSSKRLGGLHLPKYLLAFSWQLGNKSCEEKGF